MYIAFFNSVQSEWLKKRRSAAVWLTIAGGFFIPAIVIIRRIIQNENMAKENLSANIWETLYTQCWQFMAILLLPMGIILATSLITQLEYRNNGWKQLHTTPQKLTTIFLAKLFVILVMLVEFFILFDVGIYLTGVLPALFFADVPFPRETFPVIAFLKGTGAFFINSLPVLAVQYLLSMHIKNFLVPIGVGIALLVASLIAVSWQYSYVIPYTYGSLFFLKANSSSAAATNIPLWALGYFFVFTLINYVLYIYKKSRG